MAWRFHPYVLVLFGTSVLSVALLVYAIKRHTLYESKAKVVAFAALSFSIALWTFGAGVQISSTEFAVSMRFYRLSLIGSETAGPLWLLFVLAYLGRDRWLNPLTIGLVGLIPVLFIGGLVVNPESLVFIEPRLETVDGLSIIDHGYGPLFALALGNSHVTPLIGIALVSIRFFNAHGPYRTQAGLVLVSGLFPIALNVIELFDVFPPAGVGTGVSPTPMSLAVTVVALALALFYYRILDLVPIARYRIIRTMRDGYLVTDDEGQVVDANPAARTHLGVRDGQSLSGRSITELLPIEEVPGSDEDPTRIEIASNGMPRHIEVVGSPIAEGDVHLGRSILLRDVTESERYRQIIERETQLNEVVRHGLIALSSKEALAQEFCERLVAESPYLVAWIGHRGTGGNLLIDGWAGDRDRIDGPSESNEVVVGPLVRRALDSGTLTVHDDLSASEGPWTGAADDHELSTAALVPLVHHDIAHGLLCVITHDSWVPGEFERRHLENLGDMMAFAMNAIDQREALQADEVVEVTITIQDSDNYLSSLSSEPPLVNREIAVHEVGESDSAGVRHMLRVDDVPAAKVVETAETHPGVSDIVELAESERETLLLMTGSAERISEPVTETGGNVRSMRCKSGELQVVAEFPSRLTLNRALERLTERVDGVEVHSIVELHRADQRPSAPQLDEVTRKERQALETAYFSGFFDRPQQQTAGDIAEALGVARTTFLRHVRSAERKLLARLYD